MMCISLWHAFEKADGTEFENQAPVTAFGERAYIWGEEEPQSSFNICQMNGSKAGLEEGCKLNFMDWKANPKGNHHDFYNNTKLASLYIKLAKDEISHPNEYEKEMIATLIKKGYVTSKDGKFKATVPVFTDEQFKQVITILTPLCVEIIKLSQELYRIIFETLRNHTPSHLKKSIQGIAQMRLFEEAVSSPARIMHRKDYIKTNWDANEMPTTYIVVNK